MSRKELKQLAAEAKSQGWSIVRGRNHDKWFSPRGGFVVVSQTPTDHRAIKNITRDLKRAGFRER